MENLNILDESYAPQGIVSNAITKIIRDSPSMSEEYSKGGAFTRYINAAADSISETNAIRELVCELFYELCCNIESNLVIKEKIKNIMSPFLRLEIAAIAYGIGSVHINQRKRFFIDAIIEMSNEPSAEDIQQLYKLYLTPLEAKAEEAKTEELSAEGILAAFLNNLQED